MTLYSNNLKQNTSKELDRVRNITNETENALQYVRRKYLDFVTSCLLYIMTYFRFVEDTNI